eukprot:1770883-Amphidinium_carterae.1
MKGLTCAAVSSYHRTRTELQSYFTRAARQVSTLRTSIVLAQHWLVDVKSAPCLLGYVVNAVSNARQTCCNIVMATTPKSPQIPKTMKVGQKKIFPN